MASDVNASPTFPQFDEELTPDYGYVGTWEDAKALKEFFELRKALCFPALRTSTTFGKTDVLKGQRKKFKWAEADDYVAGGAIPYDGIPFIVLDKNIYECEYGVDHKLKRKENRRSRHNVEEKLKNEGEKVKKRNCPAKIRMKEVMKFPDFKINKDTRYNRNKIAVQLTTAIPKGVVRGERRIYIYFPTDSEHKGHELRSQVCTMKQHVDERLLCLIDHLVEEGVSSVDDISQQITLCVQDASGSKHEKDSIDGPALSCPDDDDIRYHVQAARVIHTYSKLTPEDLEAHVAQLRLLHKDHCIFFRKQSTTESLLLVHQSADQRDTLGKYPNGRYIIDSTCTTTRGALPLILISVQSDGIHHMVGSAILQTRSSNLITEALEILKSSNKAWKPLSFTTEFQEEDIDGVKAAFQDVPILLCDYHRVKAWNKWIAEKGQKQIGSKGTLFSILEALSNATTKEAYAKLEDQILSSRHWKEDHRFQKWFSSRWLPHYRMWARAFFPKPKRNDDGDHDVDDTDVDDITTEKESSRKHCLLILQRLMNIAQDEETSQEKLSHLASCLDSAEEKYACLTAKEGGNDAKELENEDTMLENKQVEEENMIENFDTVRAKRRKMEIETVEAGGIEVSQEPIFLDMFVQAVEIVYRNKENVSEDIVENGVQEFVAGEAQEVVSDEVQEMVSDQAQAIVPGSVQDMVPAESQQMVSSEAQEMLQSKVPMVPSDIQELVTGEGQMISSDVHETDPEGVKEMVTGQVQEIIQNEDQEMVPAEEQEMHHVQQIVPGQVHNVDSNKIHQILQSDVQEMAPSKVQHIHLVSSEVQHITPSEVQGFVSSDVSQQIVNSEVQEIIIINSETFDS